MRTVAPQAVAAPTMKTNPPIGHSAATFDEAVAVFTDLRSTLHGIRSTAVEHIAPDQLRAMIALNEACLAIVAQRRARSIEVAEHTLTSHAPLAEASR